MLLSDITSLKPKQMFRYRGDMATVISQFHDLSILKMKVDGEIKEFPCNTWVCHFECKGKFVSLVSSYPHPGNLNLSHYDVL